MKPIDIRLINAVRRIVGLLVEGRYGDLERLTGGRRLVSDHIEAGVRDYGRTLITPPESAFEKLNVIPVTGSSPPQYSIRFDLFTAEEGRSDLSIEMTLIDDPTDDEHMRVEIDNIHVL